MAGNRSLRNSSAQNVEITSKELCGLPSSLRAIQPRVGFRFSRDWAPVQVQSVELRPDLKITDHENRDSNRNQTPNSISSQSTVSSRVSESSSRLPNSSLKIPLTIPSEAWPKG
ncbi:hypothetical protein AVEN_124890-1 [Araneus ventricosus]|uniref:Uncharacterized protein n=1 Tax=Araneus ventricosus TaxID=182803 RepID=A0A4Y2FY00_ARAVE|nr:hypothetical protein AVEN_124890-1 [Araneus ventricosus]